MPSPDGDRTSPKLSFVVHVQGQSRTKREVPVKRYAEVSLPGDVTEYVRARGLRAPLVLLAGLAASAAQTLEPLWSVSAVLLLHRE